jgi:hypothetical protein
MGFAITVFTVWLVFVCASPAFAYVDPGSGSMLIQMLLGGVAGIAVLLRLTWRRLLSMLGIRRRSDDDRKDV